MEIAVSMPPRRSCFASRGEERAMEIAVSMPPRRSCFEVRLLLYVHPRRKFQCHHGVPASFSWTKERTSLPCVSMPPRRSCFEA
jgi:hypothetical protein